MSPPPSPRASHGTAHPKKKDRPLALDIPDDAKNLSFDNDTRYEHRTNTQEINSQDQPIVHVSMAEEEPLTDLEHPISRSTSTMSALDPYYFGIRSPSDSPVPPLPTSAVQPSTTPDQRQIFEPVTPARDPAAIDRRGLVGVGELATPRWTRAADYQAQDEPDTLLEGGNSDYDAVVVDDAEEDEPDSPWTIEAVDGETSEKEEEKKEDASYLKLAPRPLRNRPSIADESGGEEILYPRKPPAPLPDPTTKSDDKPSDRPSHTDANQEPVPPASPPSAFSHSTRRARKRTSDEYEMDQFGALVSKRAGNTTKGADDQPLTRKHRSLNVNTVQSASVTRDTKAKDRYRESAGLILSSSMKSPSKAHDRHIRQSSASSSTNLESPHPRRVHTTDFSHLPPSPSSSSIQPFLRHPISAGSAHNPLSKSASKDSLHPSANVAHSLLRGTQEGWSGLDDEATAEALRKLDGLHGKISRARASVVSLVRPSSSSRPGTPAGKSTSQWEGVGANESGRSKRTTSTTRDNPAAVKETEPRQNVGLGFAIMDLPREKAELAGTAVSSDELSAGATGTEKTPKKGHSASARSSLTNKRGSTSSTTYTSTPSSRDSASMSAATSMTSVSAVSGRYSTSKARRNSTSSDISSVHSSDATSIKDRVASIAISGDPPEDAVVPPVPPLPKDLSTYRSPPPTSAGLAFSIGPSVEGKEKPSSQDHVMDPTSSLEVPSVTGPPAHSPHPQGHRLSQYFSAGYTSAHSAPESTPAVLKTPSKKWSFSSALSLKISSSPSSSSQKSTFPLSPRAVSFGQPLRKSTSKDQGVSSNATSRSKNFETKQPDAMASAGSLVSLSSVGSVRTPAMTSVPSKTPDRSTALSRTGTGSSNDTHVTTSGLSAPPAGPLSPTASVRRGQSKRLTPSSIPFFRRSSSQSMQILPNSMTTSVSPTLSSGNPSSAHGTHKPATPPRDPHNPPSTTVSGSAHRKSSVLSLGLPSLLKSSSRRSLHSESKEAAKELQRAKEAEREKGKLEKAEKERQKKEEKDRSESRISVLMGRKRGKTLSSTDQRKPRSPVTLPPMQISALEPATAQRVARLKPSPTNSNSTSTHSSITRTPSSTSRLTSQTVSSMQKQSDTSLRSRNLLPTIAGSPSVGTNGTNSSQTLKDFKEPPSSLLNSAFGLPKETPTKIPRISSRTSAVASPPLKAGSALSTHRASASVNTTEPGTSSTNPSPTGLVSAYEFGVMEYDELPAKTVTTAKHSSLRGSPSASTSRAPRQSVIASATTSNLRKGSRDSVSFSARKASTGSVASLSTPAAPSDSSHHHRFSALSPSKLKLISPKVSLSAARTSNNSSQGIHQTIGTPSSGRQSLSTPSPAPTTIDEEELLGDEEMLNYIRRQQAKKLAAGATQQELDELLRFPEQLPPGTPSSPSATVRNFSQYLSDYERKEILDYPSVYCYGSKSKKKLATPDNSSNNYGYDDDRGDYLVVSRDHLAYRYEVVDTLGKGSFGQVLQCRDHCTGESVAIKIIRNKKRFHHQALVEIKILENLKKWDSDGKHHVLKMIEHFYFRNHLCIATELLSINLYELIKANGFVGFTTALIRRFTSQMLMSLTLMRHHRIVHCDLKPENVLLRHPSKSAIKVIDFGSSCFEHEKIYTYIQSRFYRSPEVILGMNYHMAIDMWSLGCILAELYTGFPIFPGENEQEQLSCIMEVLGVPDKEYVNRSSRKKLFFDPNGAPRAVINSKGRRRRPGTKTLAQVLRCNDEEFVDFISKCLVWDPERRIKPQAATRHPFVTAGRRPKPPAPAPKTTSTPSIGLTGSRSKQLTETPKKALIGAPTPLTARTSRTATSANIATPSNSAHTLGSSSRSYRSSQSQGLSSYHTSRTLSGFASTASKS